MVFLLDTNAISALMREDARMAAWLSSVDAVDRVVTCAICRGEILFGLGRLQQGRRRADLEVKAMNVLGVLPCEPVSAAAANHYADVKLAQQTRGLPLDENDLWIAATALAAGATLVSSDRVFQRVDGLTVIAP